MSMGESAIVRSQGSCTSSELAVADGTNDAFPDDFRVIADNVDDETEGIHLPEIISWNSRALFSADADAARDKPRTLASLQRQAYRGCFAFKGRIKAVERNLLW
eukprot:6261786-Amphidinium_carterae.4